MPIYQIWAEKKGKRGWQYHGAARSGPTDGRWELLPTAWVQTTFGPGAGYRGRPLIVPTGRADAAACPPSQSTGASDPEAASEASLSEARLTDAPSPSVILQGERQHCAALGMASGMYLAAGGEVVCTGGLAGCGV